jgi:hypothetical protein
MLGLRVCKAMRPAGVSAKRGINIKQSRERACIRKLRARDNTQIDGTGATTAAPHGGDSSSEGIKKSKGSEGSKDSENSKGQQGQHE